MVRQQIFYALGRNLVEQKTEYLTKRNTFTTNKFSALTFDSYGDAFVVRELYTSIFPQCELKVISLTFGCGESQA